MADRSLDHALEAVRHTEANLEHLREILRYITDIGGSLRLRMDTDTLLRGVSEAACKALRFRYSALYLSDGAGNFYARATSGINSAQRAYLAQHPVPEAIVKKLTSEEYRISDSYLIPSGAPVWDDYTFSFFVIVEDEGLPSPSPSPSPPSSPLDVYWHAEDLLIVPLFSGDNTMLGFLTPDVPVDGLRPTIETVPLFELFANQAAVVIEGTRLYEEMQRTNDERATLIEIGQALFSPDVQGDMEKTYQAIYEQIARIMPVDAFYIAHYRQTNEGEMLLLDYFIDSGVRYPPTEVGPIRPHTRDIILQQEVGRLFSTAEEYLEAIHVAAEEADEELIGSERASESFMFVPIRYGTNAIGMLSVQSYQQHAYTRRQLKILKAIAAEAGVAIINASLYGELREALKQAQESERLKNHFLMTASHELRTPLTAIQGYLELLGDFNASLNEEAKMRFVNNARRACEELVLLLGNVMDASRIDQDRVLLKLGSVPVMRAVLMILEILEPILVREERSVQLRIVDELHVWVDDLRLRQVLLNVVGNALKYTPAGSDIEIRTTRVGWDDFCLLLPARTQQPARPASGCFVVIAVRDWGPGVLLEEQPYLFTKFMRLTSAINSTQRGAGLGLYLCQQLTEAMGGSIWMESQGIPGEGSTFFIALPLHREEIEIV
ncbi:MAG: GAF domain-containing protein [Ktedonobacteraceae bacterium]|nr:GAF domain-containing protein [Ktedonobacteraceae bacterium]